MACVCAAARGRTWSVPSLGVPAAGCGLLRRRPASAQAWPQPPRAAARPPGFANARALSACVLAAPAASVPRRRRPAAAGTTHSQPPSLHPAEPAAASSQQRLLPGGRQPPHLFTRAIAPAVPCSACRLCRQASRHRGGPAAPLRAYKPAADGLRTPHAPGLVCNERRESIAACSQLGTVRRPCRRQPAIRSTARRAPVQPPFRSVHGACVPSPPTSPAGSSAGASPGPAGGAGACTRCPPPCTTTPLRAGKRRRRPAQGATRWVSRIPCRFSAPPQVLPHTPPHRCWPRCASPASTCTPPSPTAARPARRRGRRAGSSAGSRSGGRSVAARSPPARVEVGGQAGGVNGGRSRVANGCAVAQEHERRLGRLGVSGAIVTAQNRKWTPAVFGCYREALSAASSPARNAGYALDASLPAKNDPAALEWGESSGAEVLGR